MDLKEVLTNKGLTPTQIEIVELMVKGFSDKEIANQLFRSEKYIRLNIKYVYKTLRIKSRVELIMFCLPHLGMTFFDKETV